MAPRRKKTTTTMTQFTLSQAIDVINSLANAPNTKKIWRSAMATLAHYDYEGENAFNVDLKKDDMILKYQDMNILPLITDFEKVEKIVDTKIKSSKDGADIAVDTRKSYYGAILKVTNPQSPIQLSKEIHDKYADKIKEIEKISNDKRNENAPIRANLLYPNFTWLEAVNEYEKYITEHAFTNTGKGRKELRIACMVGLYILQRPRRVQDYCTLQWFSRKPAPQDFEGRNILYADGENLVLSIDKFKTRYRVAGNSTERKELLPRYVKIVNPKLADLFRDYIKKAKIKDMTKLTTPQRRANVNYYIFVKENDDNHMSPYDDNSFSKVLAAAFKYVFDKNKLSVNTFRHLFNTYIMDNASMFNDKKMQEISLDVGDTPRQMATNIRYRVANQAVAQMAKTEIDGIIADNDYAKNLMIANAEEEGSVGNVGDGGNVADVVDVVDADEVVSPAPRPVPPQLPLAQTDTVGGGAGVVDEDLAVLYTRLGEATMQVELIKSLIAKKLNF
jgi:hypothetical protein